VRWRASALRPALLLLGTQVSLVLYAARVAGLHDSAWAALAWCVPAFVAAFVVLALVNRHAEGLASRS